MLMRACSVATVAALVWAGSASADPLPVGYDDPGTDRGGPVFSDDGGAWVHRVFPQGMTLAPEPAWDAPTVMFLTNYGGAPTVQELARRFPMRVLHVRDEEFGHAFPGRDVFERKLAKVERIDCFVVSRMDVGSIPLDVQYEIFRRVVEDGAGLVVIDVFDRSETFDADFLDVQWRENDPALFPAIPYESFREWAYQDQVIFEHVHQWRTSGQADLDPQAEPFAYRQGRIGRLGRGTVVWAHTGSDTERVRSSGNALIPHIQQRRDMWVETDYYFSYAAKAIRRAAGIQPRAEIADVRFAEADDGDLVVELVTQNFTPDPLWDHRLRWQVRDTWGRVLEAGERPFRVTEDRMTHPLDWIDVTDAGRRFVDLWLETADGRTIDWGTGFIERDRGVSVPSIDLDHPEGTPRGEPIAGTVRFNDEARNAGADAGADVAAVRVRLFDRHWRTVHSSEHPVNATDTAIDFAIESAGLEGVIWQLHVDLLDDRGHVLAEAHATATSPKSFDDQPGFYAIGTIDTHSSPVGAARRELVGRLGFTGSRPYTGGSAMIAEASAWQDWEMFPHAVRVTSSDDDYTGPRVNDWADPQLMGEYQQILATIADEMRRFGHRGYNLTDDSSAARELPLGIYTTLAFHDWLEATYGSPAEIAEAWGIDPGAFEQFAHEASEHSADRGTNATNDDVRFPRSAHVAEAFQRWLEDRYGSVQSTFRQWEIEVSGRLGRPHSWGRVHYVLIEEQAENGNNRPWHDAQEFLREQSLDVHPLGHIEQSWIRRKHDQGVTEPWIDAQRFGGFRWIDTMQQLREGARAANDDLFVGTDAGFYHEHLGEVFGHFDYLAPYRGDWWALHTAVARGAHRRTGIFGSCIGSYEQQPPRMYDLRAQPWAILFNGGTGLYYWSFTRGLLGDMTLSDDHALYQTEVTEEIGRGIGDLFTSAERIFDRVAILDSQHSGLNDRLADPEAALTTHRNSTLAFHRMLMTDLGLTPKVVTATELADGWLDHANVRVLILPGISAMADAEIDAIRRFVAGGGTLIADVLPGRLHPNGRQRDASPLAELFGVRDGDDPEQPRQRGELSWNGQPLGQTLAAYLEPSNAQAHGSVGNAVPAIFEHRHGDGTTWLFNAFAGTYEAVQRAGNRDAAQAWFEHMRELLLDAGLEPTVTASADTRAPGTLALSPFRQSGGYLLGVEDRGTGLEQEQWREVELILPEALHIYESRGGQYLGEADVLRDEIPRRGHRAYALLPYAVEDVTLALNARTLDAGEALRVDVGLTLDHHDAPANEHVIRLEVFDPDGQRFYPHRRILEVQTDTTREAILRTSSDDAPGTWTVRATDVSTGVATEQQFELQSTGE